MAGTVWPSSAAVNNPIQWVKTSTSGSAKYVRCPSAYHVEIDDISNPDAGRTANGEMVKSQLYVGGNPVRAKSISLEWYNISDNDIAGLLTVFQSAEYLYVSYFDTATAAYKQEWFYVGNRTMPMYNKPMKIWTTLALKLISRNKA